MVIVLAERVIFQIAELILVCKKIAAIMNNFQLHKLQKIGWKNLQNIALIVKLLYWPVIFKDSTAQAFFSSSYNWD